mgnify:CR=1 FL=1
MKSESEGYRKKAELPGDIRFNDIFEPEEIQQLQDLFSDATGVSSVITDTLGNHLTRPTNFRRLCRDIIRPTVKGMEMCRLSDVGIGRLVSSKSQIFPCLSCGLWESGVGIYAGGKHIANWLIGQVRNESIDVRKMTEIAVEIGVDVNDFMVALEEVPVMSLEQFEKVAKMLSVYVNGLSGKAYDNYIQNQKIADLDKARVQLQESEIRFRNLLMNVQSVSVQGYDPEGNTLYWNKASEQLYGYSAKEAIGRNLLDLIIPPDLRIPVGHDIARMAETGVPVPPSELLLMRSDGSRVPVFSSHTIVQIPGKAQELYCIDVDLTERRHT